MSKESFIFVLGIIIAVTPFLGIPGSWKQYVLVISGILIVIVSYQLRRAAFFRSIETPQGERKGDAFVESNVLKVHQVEDEDAEQSEVHV